ncbi:hypothetical protein HPP_5040 [Hydrangea phyllody phytoplasma]|uniref:Uncharacterized protein n=2 Tax=16SrI (Aster yellows group) TaxID=3042590 RepID=A0ABQ5PSL3_9MOLU|nr:hypothetical protein [Hydrangea phyllody phytoplasma]GFZ75546.1 hypothetical protein HPP_5040 [Hydrangea phyllody phytoplasma]GLH61492.1 hypothetical protein RHYP_4380 [Rhus yellows phytoplasma]GLH62091.1 hypothetical protein HP2P_4980 [Hydrangea phyllody phytoplasma]
MEELKKQFKIFFYVTSIFLSIFTTYLLTRQIGLKECINSQSKHLKEKINQIKDNVDDAKKQTQEHFEKTHKKLDELIEKLDKENNKENE